MINEERLQARLEDCNTAYDNFETAVTELLEGKKIKPSEIAALKDNFKYKFNTLNETIKYYCK